MNFAASLALCPLLCAPLIAGESLSSHPALPIATPTKKGESAPPLKDSFTFVDRSKFVARGNISYSVPKERADGIEVADARKLKTDLSGILKLLNEIETQNQDFKIGKGPARKNRGNANGPKIQGCIDSVLIAKDGKLVLEEYFADARVDRPHYQMSITKSIHSYAIGKAIESGKIKSENALLIDYLPEVDRSKIAKGTETLTLKDLLTMSSSIRFGARSAEPKCSIEDHAQHYLAHTTPIPEKKRYRYDGRNNDLLAHVLYNSTGKKLGEYVQEHLFGPLGITDFAFGPSLCGLDKGSAGMRLRSRDMLKIGLLTAHGGTWKGTQILNREWIEKATAVHVNQGQAHQYGYFWWSQEITVKGKAYRVRSCRGAGGQFILVQPELGLVAVFTSYYATNRPLQHFEKIIAPAFAE
jgi:hypothetical protein